MTTYDHYRYMLITQRRALPEEQPHRRPESLKGVLPSTCGVIYSLSPLDT